MRIILGLCLATLAIGATLIWNATRLPTQYGEFSGAPRADVTALLERPKDFLNQTVLVEGEVREQCKTMGCHFYFTQGDKTLRVDLETITGKAPTREGRPARVEGRVMLYGDGYQLVASAVRFL